MKTISSLFEFKSFHCKDKGKILYVFYMSFRVKNVILIADCDYLFDLIIRKVMVAVSVSIQYKPVTL